MSTKSDKNKRVQTDGSLRVPNKGTQAAFLEALVKRKGNISGAARDAEVTRSQVYEWKEKDPAFLKLYKETRKELEEFLFEKACEHGEYGDSTLLIFSLKALNRARFDDQFIKQKYALDRGANPDGSVPLPVRAVLVRDEEPWEVVQKPYVDPDE